MKPSQLRVIECFPHYGLFPHLHLFLRPLAPLAFHVVHPTFPQVVHPIFFTLISQVVDPSEFSQVFNLIFSDGGYRPAATFLSVSLHPGFEEWDCFWFSLSCYDKYFSSLEKDGPLNSIRDTRYFKLRYTFVNICYHQSSTNC